MFLSSLRKQMDRMSSSMRRGRLEEAAQNYLDEGCGPGEVQELLDIDGYNPQMIRACLSKLASFEEPDSKMPKWGFEFEDGYGRTISNFDLDVTITADSEKEALEKVGHLLSPEDNRKRETLKVFRI